MFIGHNEKLRSAVEEAAWEIDKTAKNDIEIIRGISEYLQKNVKYDYKMCNIMYHHEAYGALVSRCAVCDGFAKAFKLIAEYLGFKCWVVSGKKKDLSAFFIGHAWNIIEYNGRCYHIDVTWDANFYESIGTYSYAYFGISDDEMIKDHMWNFLSLPRCKGYELSYYYANNLQATSEGQIFDILVRCLKQRNNTIRVRVNDGIPLGKNEKEYMVNKLEQARKKVGLYCSYTYSWQKEQRCFTVMLNK